MKIPFFFVNKCHLQLNVCFKKTRMCGGFHVDFLYYYILYVTVLVTVRTRQSISYISHFLLSAITTSYQFTDNIAPNQWCCVQIIIALRPLPMGHRFSGFYLFFQQSISYWRMRFSTVGQKPVLGHQFHFRWLIIFNQSKRDLQTPKESPHFTWLFEYCKYTLMGTITSRGHYTYLLLSSWWTYINIVVI